MRLVLAERAGKYQIASESKRLDKVDSTIIRIVDHRYSETRKRQVTADTAEQVASALAKAAVAA